ncbi:hypothetical protein HDK77DRAFT_483309 [Phyllosticta capitalensis]
MLKRIPQPLSIGGKAPRRTYPWYTHFEDLNGRPTLSLWWDPSHPNLPPLFSFQVYVTHEASPVQNADREALARELYDAILGNKGHDKRVDVHFLRPGESTSDCVESHRALVKAKHTTLAQAVIPSYEDAAPWHCRSFIYVLSNSNWKEAGLTGVYFDHNEPEFPDAADDFSESTMVGFEIEEVAGIFFCHWHLRDEYMDLFSDAQDAGMTDWEEVFKAAGRLGMDQW